MHPVTNSMAPMNGHVDPQMPKREVIASELFRYRLAKGKQKSEARERALDLRHIERRGEWQTSTGATSRSRSFKRFESVSPIRDEH